MPTSAISYNSRLLNSRWTEDSLPLLPGASHLWTQRYPSVQVIINTRTGPETEFTRLLSGESSYIRSDPDGTLRLVTDKGRGLKLADTGGEQYSTFYTIPVIEDESSVVTQYTLKPGEWVQLYTHAVGGSVKRLDGQGGTRAELTIGSIDDLRRMGHSGLTSGKEYPEHTDDEDEG